jgi:hypothetical protein
MKQQFFKQLNRVQTAAKLAAGALTVAAVNAHAALPANVETDVGTAKTDMLTGIGLVIGAMVAVWGLKKLGSKLGWL